MTYDHFTQVEGISRFNSCAHHVTTTLTKNNDAVTTNTAIANAGITHIPREKASHGLDEIEDLTTVNRTTTENAINTTCKIPTNNGVTALSLYNRIFKVESRARRLMQHLFSSFYGVTVRGTLLERVMDCLWASHPLSELLIINIYPKPVC